MKNNSGKTLTILAILMVIVLLSSTCIGFFLYHKERTNRKALENDLEIANEAQAKALADVAQLKKQLTLAQDKNKEADEKINNLLDEIELNDGVRNELKKENDNLKSQLDTLTKTKEQHAKEIDDINKKLTEAEAALNTEKESNKNLSAQLEELKSAKPQEPPPAPTTNFGVVDPKVIESQKVELDKIVVNPQDTGIKGRIVSVDKDTEFVIFNLGNKQGIKSGDVLSVYRGEEYLGDIKATRVQEQLSAADLIPPFSSRKVRKNDIVMIKPE